MRIGIDGRYIQDHFPGIGRYAYSLTKAMIEAAPQHQFIIYCDPTAKNTRFDLDTLVMPNSSLHPMPVGVFSPKNVWIWRKRLAADGIDVFYSPYYTKPLFTPCPAVVTFHDLIPLRFPEYLPSRKDRYLYLLTAFLSTRTAAAILADSNSAKNDTLELMHAAPSQVRVVYVAHDDIFRPYPIDEARSWLENYRLPPRYVLYIGTNKPHKNVPMLVRAWKQVTDSIEDKDVSLVIAGQWDSRYPEAKAEAERLSLGERVHFVGEMPEETLPYLYGAAEIFVFPSLYEGFGLPTLEAMASGVPVICSNTSSLPEVVGGGAIMLPPDDTDAWTTEITSLLSDRAMREDMAHKELERAKQFSWQASAESALEVIESTARTGKKR